MTHTLLVVALYVAKLDVNRLSLTPAAINAAREVLVATAGTAKAEALAHVLDGPYDPGTYPAQVLDPADGHLMWYVDRAALATA